MPSEVNKGRKHIRNTQLCDTQTEKDRRSSCPRRCHNCRDVSREPKLDLVKRHRSRLGQILRETHFRPSLHWADGSRTGTEWHLVSRHTSTPANQHTAWRSNFRLSSRDSIFFSLKKDCPYFLFWVQRIALTLTFPAKEGNGNNNGSFLSCPPKIPHSFRMST